MDLKLVRDAKWSLRIAVNSILHNVQLKIESNVCRSEIRGKIRRPRDNARL